jgi:hypothetical protein
MRLAELALAELALAELALAELALAELALVELALAELAQPTQHSHKLCYGYVNQTFFLLPYYTNTCI